MKVRVIGHAEFTDIEYDLGEYNQGIVLDRGSLIDLASDETIVDLYNDDGDFVWFDGNRDYDNIFIQGIER